MTSPAPFREPFPLVGMVHLGALPGSPRFGGSLDAVLEAAERDARALVEGGASGLLVENYGDAPFFPNRVPRVTVAAMAVAARRIVERFPIPVGVQVLRNDARAGLAVAVASGASFLRVNVLAGTAAAGEGILRGEAHHVLRERSALGAAVAIWADFRAKHAAPIGERALDVELRELVARAGADVVVVSGAATGSAPDPGYLERVRAAAGAAPLVLGSGFSARNAGELARFVDGAIVGTDVKQGGVTTNAVDPERMRALAAAASGAARGGRA